MRCPFCPDEHAPGTVVCPTTQQRIAGILTEGTVIDEKYKILGMIGTGGMAVVYRAEHLKIGRIVALKMLLPELVAYQELVTRVEREARAAGGIGSPNVVEVVDLGKTAEYGPYIAMELLQGEDLATYTENRGNTLDPVEAADIVRQVLAGLAAAHAKGVIHRDLKPENVFLAEQNEGRRRVKVLDFGISKLLSESGVNSLTRTGSVMGTPQYMAPEQAAGSKNQDHRVDLYACGVVLYAVLTGTLPYEAENYNLLINEILNKPPIEILSRNPDLDADLAGIVMKSIAREPDARYASALEMQEALVAWLTAQGRNVSVLVPVSALNAAAGGEPRKSPSVPNPIMSRGTQPTIPALTPPPSTTRGSTQTPMGWEEQKGAPASAPPPARRGGWLAGSALVLAALGGGLFAWRSVSPKTWRNTMGSAEAEIMRHWPSNSGADASTSVDRGAHAASSGSDASAPPHRSGTSGENAGAHTPTRSTPADTGAHVSPTPTPASGSVRPAPRPTIARPAAQVAPRRPPPHRPPLRRPPPRRR